MKTIKHLIFSKIFLLFFIFLIGLSLVIYLEKNTSNNKNLDSNNIKISHNHYQNKSTVYQLQVNVIYNSSKPYIFDLSDSQSTVGGFVADFPNDFSYKQFSIGKFVTGINYNGEIINAENPYYWQIATFNAKSPVTKGVDLLNLNSSIVNTILFSYSKS